MCSSKVTIGLVPGSGNTVSILKYSIATLLLCASSVVAGIHTYLAISAILSAAAVPVLFAVIAFVSASIVVSSTVYLINSFFSAVSSEKKIDLNEKKPGYQQPSELEGNKECKHKVPEKQQQKNNNNAAKMQPVTKVPTAPDTLPVSPLPNGAPAASPLFPPPPPLPHSAAPPPPLAPCNTSLSGPAKSNNNNDQRANTKFHW
ncbi:MAG: hypothetical protein ACR5K9_08610 [Wolbachia sp.]